MPIIGDHVEIERKPKLGGGGPGKIPYRRGYGDDDGDRGRSGDPFSRNTRLRRYRTGMALCIACVTVLFIGLIVAYVARQGTPHWDQDQSREIYDWHPLLLPYRQLWINSLLLVLSSIALELARRGTVKKTEFSTLGIVPPKHLPWLAITAVLGFGFLAGQILVWHGFRAQGLFLSSNPSSSFFFLLTGLHALHLAGGLIALLYVPGGRWMNLRLESQMIAVDVTAWYWHFMGVLWFSIFALLHFARG